AGGRALAPHPVLLREGAGPGAGGGTPTAAGRRGGPPAHGDGVHRLRDRLLSGLPVPGLFAAGVVRRGAAGGDAGGGGGGGGAGGGGPGRAARGTARPRAGSRRGR